MDKVIQPAPPVIGAAWGQVATLNLAVGSRRHVIWLEVTATPASGVTFGVADLYKMIDLISVKINGKPQRMHTAQELDLINTAYGAEFGVNAYNFDTGVLKFSGGAYQAPQAGKQTVWYLPIFFAEPWRKSYAAQESFAWYTSWQNGSSLSSFSIEITCLSPANTVILANSSIGINLFEEIDTAQGPLDSNKNPVAIITKWYRNGIPYTAAGDLYVTTLPKRDVYLQISAFQATDDITRAQVKVDARIVRDVMKARNDQTLMARGMNEAALTEKRFDIMFDYSDVPSDGLVMQAGSSQVQDFQVILSLPAVNGAGIVSVVSQVYGGID